MGHAWLSFFQWPVRMWPKWKSWKKTPWNLSNRPWCCWPITCGIGCQAARCCSEVGTNSIGKSSQASATSPSCSWVDVFPASSGAQRFLKIQNWIKLVPNSISKDKPFQIRFKCLDCARLSTKNSWTWHYCFCPTGSIESQEDGGQGTGRYRGHSAHCTSKWQKLGAGGHTPSILTDFERKGLCCHNFISSY